MRRVSVCKRLYKKRLEKWGMNDRWINIEDNHMALILSPSTLVVNLS